MSAFRRRTRRTVGASAVTAALVAGACLLAQPVTASAALVAEPVTYSAEDAAISLTAVGSYETGVFDESAAEIIAYHAGTQRLFVVNAQAGAVDVLDVSDPTAPAKLFSIVDVDGGVANSVAIRADGLGVIALEADVKTDDGSLLFFDAATPVASAADAALGSVTVGALPDMVSISADGAWAVVANEGEPADDFSVDPEGSVGIVSLPGVVAAPSQEAYRTADFHDFEEGGSKTLPEDVRVFGPAPEADFPVSRNLEPEYIAIDGGTAYAALQEANAVAVVDIATAEVTEIWPLGFKDHGIEGNGIDPSDRDPRDAPTFDIRTFPGLKGMYMPDGMNAYRAGDQTYLVTANEGDAREWGAYEEGDRAKNLDVCTDSPLAGLLGDADLGRLNVTTEDGFDEARGCYSELYAFGGRSFSIWTVDGEQVFDSGDEFERITHAANPAFFNSNHSGSNLEGRSDDKGPEPENLAIGQVGGRTYAFIGLERVGGIVVYDITTPTDSTFVTYLNNRDFSFSVEDAEEGPEQAAALAGAGDLGPEGVAFLAADGSPTGEPMLAVGNEVSGTTTLFSIESTLVEEPADPWAVIELGSGTVAQGGTLPVRVTGLDAGQQISAVLRSATAGVAPIVATGIPAADASGATSFSIAIPVGFAVGSATLEVSSAGQEPLTAAVTVTAAAPDPGTPGTGGPSTPGAGAPGAGTGAGSAGDGSLASTGSDATPFAAFAALLLAAGIALVARRRVTARG